MKAYIVSTFVVLCLAVFLVWISARPTKPEVVVANATLGEIEATVTTTGTVVPSEDFVARPSSPSEVSKIYVELGQHVKVGQRLVSMKDNFARARIDSAEANLESTEVARDNIKNNGTQEERINFASDLQRAQNEASLAQESLETIEKLNATGDASPVEVSAAQNRLHAAQDALGVIREKLNKRFSLADQHSWNAHVIQARATLDAENANLSGINITSPIDGVVYLIPVVENAFVPAGFDLVRVENPNTMKVNANFDEPEIGGLHQGQSVIVTWDGNPGHTWHGHIQHVPLAVVVQGSRSIGEASILLDDARQDLPVHTNVTVRVLLQRRSKVLVIPREAFNQDRLGFFVYRVRRGDLIRTAVNVGLITIDKVEITGGLADGDLIALHRTDEGAMSNHLAVQIAE